MFDCGRYQGVMRISVVLHEAEHSKSSKPRRAFSRCPLFSPSCRSVRPCGAFTFHRSLLFVRPLTCRSRAPDVAATVVVVVVYVVPSVKSTSPVHVCATTRSPCSHQPASHGEHQSFSRSHLRHPQHPNSTTAHPLAYLHPLSTRTQPSLTPPLHPHSTANTPLPQPKYRSHY